MDSAPHQCTQNVAEVEVEKTKFICRQRAREDVTASVSQIYRQEFGKVLSKGFELGAQVKSYNSLKTALCRARRASLAASKNKKPGKEIEVSEDILCKYLNFHTPPSATLGCSMQIQLQVL